MFLTTVLCACVILAAFLFLRKPSNKNGKDPPGPIPLPLLGNLLQIGFRPHLKFTQWAKRYGPIYKMKLGLDDAIVVTDYKLIKEILNEPSSTGRLGDNALIMEFTKGPNGIINSSGEIWEVHRKFTVRALRSFGFAKTSMETMILDEVQIMLDWFKKREGSLIPGVRLFNAPVVNSLWRIVNGERCQWEESRAFIFDAMDTFFQESMNVSTNGLFFVPALRFISPNLFGWTRYVESINTMMKIFEDAITKHKETFNPTELRDYIDHHLMEIESETDTKSGFYKEAGLLNLKAGLFDLFLAGSETSASSLSWALLHLSENQKIQKSLQNEIDKVVGSRSARLSDRVNMPYSEATVAEILRISSVAPVGIPHEMTSDLIFHGYRIPKKTTVFSNLYGVHHDPEIWGDPEVFRPERFLNEDGTKFVRHEALIPFAEGKRKCIGETLARDTIFLFVTSIFQQFDILPDPDVKGEVDLEPDFGLILAPKPFNVLVSSRKKIE